jgi:hypothetical protein
LFFPVGVFFIWRSSWPKAQKVIASLVFGTLFITIVATQLPGKIAEQSRPVGFEQAVSSENEDVEQLEQLKIAEIQKWEQRIADGTYADLIERLAVPIEDKDLEQNSNLVRKSDFSAPVVALYEGSTLYVPFGNSPSFYLRPWEMIDFGAVEFQIYDHSSSPDMTFFCDDESATEAVVFAEYVGERKIGDYSDGGAAIAVYEPVVQFYIIDVQKEELIAWYTTQISTGRSLNELPNGYADAARGGRLLIDTENIDPIYEGIRDTLFIKRFSQVVPE